MLSNQKGVVMRVTGKKTVVYTAKGDFIQITTPTQNLLVGQTIEFCIKSRPFFTINALFKYATTAAVLFLILTLGLMYPLLWPLGGAVASVELNINNGISLQLNKEGKVTNVHNAGVELNSADDGLPLKGLDVYQAVKLIVEDAALKGDFGHEQSVVMVSVVSVVRSGADAVDSDKLRGVVHEELLKQNANGVVMVGKLSRESGSKAQSLGMTANNYLVYERCQQDGLDVQADVFRGRNVQEAMVEVNVSLPKLFPGEYLEVTRQDGIKTEEKEVKEVKEEVIVYTGQQVQEQIPERVVKESRRLQPGSRSSTQRGNEDQVRVYNKYEEQDNGVRTVTGQGWPLGSTTKNQERKLNYLSQSVEMGRDTDDYNHLENKKEQELDAPLI